MALINNFPYDGVVTINRVILKKQFTIDDLQMRVAEMCENVKTYHSDTGFIGGMVVLNSGQISNEGSTIGHALDSDLKNLRFYLNLLRVFLFIAVVKSWDQCKYT